MKASFGKQSLEATVNGFCISAAFAFVFTVVFVCLSLLQDTHTEYFLLDASSARCTRTGAREAFYVELFYFSSLGFKPGQLKLLYDSVRVFVD